MTNAHVYYCTFEHEQMIVPACTVVLLIPTLEKKGHLSCCSWYRQLHIPSIFSSGRMHSFGPFIILKWTRSCTTTSYV